MALVIDSPSPTPGMAFWVAVEARKNRANNRSSSSAGIPTPVSLTEISALGADSPPVPRVTATRPPAGVNLTALEIRLSTAWPCLLYTSDAADEEDSVDL